MDAKQEAIKLFNETWDLLDLEDRSNEQKVEMIQKAHTSCYLWSQVGTALNVARGEWQVSRVYSVLGMGKPALLYALNSLKLCMDNSIGDFDLAFAYEAIARAYTVLDDKNKAEEYQSLGIEACNKIAKDDDREYVLGELNSIK